MKELMPATHVALQITSLSKTFLAHIAFVRSLVRVNTHVDFQITRMTKTLLANIAFIRFLVSVNTHVDFQTTRFTKMLLAHIAFVRFLVRVSTHMYGQLGWTNKHLLANIALVPSLPLHSFSNTSRFLFSHPMILLHNSVSHGTHMRILRNRSTSSSSLSSSLSPPFLTTTTVFTFSARFGCLFFRLLLPVIDFNEYYYYCAKTTRE